MRALVLAAVGPLAPASCFVPTAQCFAQVTPAPNSAQIITALVDDYQKRDIATLLTGRTQPDRDDAARRLIARQSASGRSAILDALLRRDNLSAQLAAARAAADDPAPDPRMIDPLGELLGLEKTTEAATSALLNYHDEARAVDKIRIFVTDTQKPRTAAIRTLGQSADIRIAAILIELVQRDASKANFAADALVEMTQLAENGRDPAAWAAWWKANQNRPADQFRAEMLERSRRRHPPVLADTDGLITRLYQLTADKDKPEALRRILESADSPFRAGGVRLTFQVFNSTGRLPPGVQERLREMLRDGSADVRLEVARVLLKLNDRASLEQILAQLRVEPDAEVESALILAVVPMVEQRTLGLTLPELVRLLSDPSIRIATVSAETIAKLGPLIRQDPGLTAATIDALTKATTSRKSQDTSGNFRAACVEALVPLNDPDQLDNFMRLLDARQPVRIRKAALAGLGALRSLRDVNVVFDIVRNDREDNGVRVSAVQALEKLGAAGFAGQLFTLARQPGEDDEVRKAATQAFVSLLPQAAETQLDAWAKTLLDAGEHEARVPVLKEKVTRLRAARPPRVQELAATLESLGDALVRAKQPALAIAPLQEALGIWEKQNSGASAASVRTSLLGAYLAGKLYPDAVKFAQDAIDRDPRNQPDVVPTIANEVDRLNRANSRADASKLATEALTRMRGLEERYKSWLTQGKNEADSRP